MTGNIPSRYLIRNKQEFRKKEKNNKKNGLSKVQTTQPCIEIFILQQMKPPALGYYTL